MYILAIKKIQATGVQRSVITRTYQKSETLPFSKYLKFQITKNEKKHEIWGVRISPLIKCVHHCHFKLQTQKVSKVYDTIYEGLDATYSLRGMKNHDWTLTCVKHLFRSRKAVDVLLDDDVEETIDGISERKLVVASWIINHKKNWICNHPLIL